MAIYDPQLRISKAEAATIRLIDWLLRRSDEAESSTNSGAELLEVSPSEARQLADFLDEFRHSRKFMEGAYFTEAVASHAGLADARAKEIFLSWRTLSGRTRVASTFAWNELVARAGFSGDRSAQLYVRGYRGGVRPMELPYFLAMEIRLAHSYQLSDRATEIITEFFNRRLRLIEEVRNGQRTFPKGAVEQTASDMFDAFDSVAKCSPKKSISRRRLAACAGLIMDVGALFITRDWTAAGVASVVGSTFPDLVGIE